MDVEPKDQSSASEEPRPKDGPPGEREAKRGESAGTEGAGRGGRGLPADRRKLLRGGVIILALLVALIAWLATRGGDGESAAPEPSARSEGTPRIVTVYEIREVAARLGQPIYWAGPLGAQELELTELPNGVQVHYLPAGTAAGKGSSETLTLGSYPLADPLKAIEGFAKRPEAIVRHAADGRLVVVSEKTPTSAFFASPGNSVQVEVYDPSPKRALGLALSGRVQPAG